MITDQKKTANTSWPLEGRCQRGAKPAFYALAVAWLARLTNGCRQQFNTTMKPNFCNTHIPLANAFDPDQTRGESGNFSADLSDAMSAAHAASATAHEKGDAESHTRAAKLHRVAAKRALAENKPGHAATHEGIAKGHDAMAACCEDDPVLANASAEAIDDDGWALIAPFGNHAKTRIYRENGLVKEQKFIQVLDNESADAMVGKEKSMFGKKYMGTIRTTFVIDEKGIISEIIDKVKTEDHTAQILK